jgi:hypothetical protein
MGEVRSKYGKKTVYVIGFFVCFSLFLVTWYKSAIWVLLLISFVGAIGAVIGEMKKFWWLDDDFMIQILPAILILIIWYGLNSIGFNILPDSMIQPFNMPW